MASKYNWLRIAGFVTLGLAALLLAYALWHAGSEPQPDDIGVRAEAMMNAIEAEAQRMENASAQP